MSYIKPFLCVHPDETYASSVAALPYDVYSRKEAFEIVKNNPLSFLKIDRPETNFEDAFPIDSDEVYKTAASILNTNLSNGIYTEEKEESLYLYELIWNGHSQTGIVGCASVDEYLNGTIKKHEHTRMAKETDRTRHIEHCAAHTGLIFLAYRSNQELHAIIQSQKKLPPVCRFTSDDNIEHIIYRITAPDVIKSIQTIFSKISHVYIADGHHRAAAAVTVAKQYRKKNPSFTGKEEFNYFLSAFFSEEELHILDYNRVVKDLNGLSVNDFLQKLDEKFTLIPLKKAIHPMEKGTISMLLENKWYLCRIKPEFISNGPIDSLDVSLLQKHILAPILHIHNPREDMRIDFVGGIRGLEELERRCRCDCKAAFALYPTSIQELFSAADKDLLMPPKSTWFEPKLRSGLFIHRF